MLCALIATVIICLLQQGVGQDISSLSVCVNLESNYLLVEWKPPFPDNADTLDVHCSSLNDTFVNSFTVRLSSEIANTIAVQVPVHGGGVHLGYIYVIQATLQTTDGIQIHSDPITVVADYFQGIYWLFKSNHSVTFHCMLSTLCSRVIGGCMVSLMSIAGGHSINQTIPVVGRIGKVEGSFDNLNLSVSYSFTATAVRRDLITPLGRVVSGIIPAITFNDVSRNTTTPTPSVTTPAQSVTSKLTTVILSSSLTSHLSTASSIKLPSLSSSIQSSSLLTISTSSVIKLKSSSSVIIPTSTGTGQDATSDTGQDVTSGRTQSSSKALPAIVVIGIVCGIVLLLVGIFAFVLTIMSKMRPQRRSLAAAADTKQHKSMFWPFNVSSCKRNGQLHPSIDVDCTLGTNQHRTETVDSNTDTSGYMKMASQVQKQPSPAEYEVPIKSPSPKTDRAPVPIDVDVNAIYEMPTVPNQTAYLTEDFKNWST